MVEKIKYQIFVSSTYVDLIEERQIAVSSILKAGHIPAGMELFTSGDKSQLDVIKKWIDESDIYMLIVGTRYGSLEPVSGLSYTEVEYDYAVNSGKPFFALVMGDIATDNKLKENGTKFLEQDESEKFKKFRTKVLSKMCSIFNENSQIRSAVYESVIDFSNSRNLIGWVPGSLLLDTTPLYQKIDSLTLENEKIKGELSQLKMQGSIGEVGEDFSDLQYLLKSIKVSIPASISNSGEEAERTMNGLLITNRNILVQGFSVHPTHSEKSKWFLSNVYTILATHRILKLDRDNKGIYHIRISEKGLDYLAWIDRTKLSGADIS